MQWRNSLGGFGLISRVLHWTMAVGIIIMLAVGLRLSRLELGTGTQGLFSFHRSLGIVILMLAVLRLVWHRISPPPRPIGVPTAWSTLAARCAHALMYGLMIAIPLSGWFANSATGTDILLFDRWTLPPIAPVSDAWVQRGFAVHRVMTNILFAVIGVHMMGALKREMEGDGTLTRMIKGKVDP